MCRVQPWFVIGLHDSIVGIFAIMIFKYHISSDTVDADDTTLILDGSEKSLSEAVEVLNLQSLRP